MYFILDGIVIPRKPGTIKINTEIPGMSQNFIDHINNNNSLMNWIISNGHYPDFHKKGGKTHKPFGHRSILDNGWQSTKQLKNKKNIYEK